jgi:CubicO group peptidase (beta-lactamase class C family)
MVHVIAYHNRSESEHANFASTYLPQGYKYLSISIYGPPDQPLYAGVLMDGFAPNSQQEAHAMDGELWQTIFNDQAAAGWGPVMAVATGPVDQAVYAAVFEPMDSIPLTLTGLLPAEFDNYNQQALGSKPPTMLSWAGLFGTADDPRYIGIWVPNPNRIVWNVSRLSPAEDQQWFDASNYQWARQVFSVYSPDVDEYVSIYRDDAPTNYVAYDAMTPDDYQIAFDANWAQGCIPTCVQGAGLDNVLITPTFTQFGSTGERTWSAPQGPPPAAKLAGFDDYMQAYMQRNRVRAGALAVVKDTRLVLARGYTCAEAGYPTTYPDSIFRIASCSKLITAVAMLQLVDRNVIALDTPILDKLPFPLLPFTPGYEFIAQLTVDDLLSMISGYDGSILYEGDVAAQLALGAFPINKQQRALVMMLTQALVGPPGSTENYCNLGYSLLGMVLETVTGQSYADYVLANIFGPLGVMRAQLDVPATDAQPMGAVLQHDLNAANSRTVLAGIPWDAARPFVPLVYGGADYSTYDGYGGWSMAAVDYAAFLAAMNLSPCPYFGQPGMLALLSTQNSAYASLGPSIPDPGWARGWSIDSRPPVAARWWGGTLSDVGCFFSLDDNRVGIVCFMNTGMNYIDTSYWDGLRGIANGISDWGTDDLFFDYGLTLPAGA